MFGGFFGRSKTSPAGRSKAKANLAKNEERARGLEAKRAAKLERQKDLRSKRNNSVTEFYVSESSESDGDKSKESGQKSESGSEEDDEEEENDSAEETSNQDDTGKGSGDEKRFKEASKQAELDVEPNEEEESGDKMQNATENDVEEEESEYSSDGSSESSGDDMVSEEDKGYKWDLADVDLAVSLLAFYERYNPERKAMVGEIVETYQDDEQIMLRVLCDRYKLDQGEMQSYLDLGITKPKPAADAAEVEEEEEISPTKSALKKPGNKRGSSRASSSSIAGGGGDDNNGDNYHQPEPERERRVSISTEHNIVTHIETKDEAKQAQKQAAAERKAEKEKEKEKEKTRRKSKGGVN